MGHAAGCQGIKESVQLKYAVEQNPSSSPKGVNEMNATKIEQYLSLLAIRKNGKQQETYFLGVIFWISFIALIVLGLIDRLNGKSMLLVAAMVVVFGFSYLTSWVKLETIRNLVDLLHNIQEDE
jgi:hypothetical protein